MYSANDELKLKRKILYVIIGIIAFLILILILFLIVRVSDKDKIAKKDKKLSCTIEILNNVVPNSEGIYNDEVEVGITKVINVSDKATITKKEISIDDTIINNDTFKITKTGTYNLKGRVQDSKGAEATCDLTVSVELSRPICTLKVIEGKEGENGWYKSNVVVSFGSVNANNASIGVSRYFIEKSDTQVNVATHENTTKYIVEDDDETELTGYIIDTNGETSTCSITIKKDTTPPKCTLKVIKGNANQFGNYIDNPVVGFNTESDDISGITEKGIGSSKNYTDETFTVTTQGRINVKGFVKDAAGNEGTCSIDVGKIQQDKSQLTETPNCTLHISPAYKLDKENTVLMPTNNNGEQRITITMTTNNAVSFGMGTSETFNGQNEFVISKEGTYKIAGFAQNANGVKVMCETPTLNVKEGELLYKKAKFGDYVAYDAGGGKNNGQKCNESDTAILGGWRVLNFDNKNKQVILVSAGSPECIEHQKSSITTLTEIKSRAKNYINKNYAVSAEALTCNSFGVAGCKFSLENRPIHITNGHYFLASRASDTEMWAINPYGIPEKLVNFKAGIRIVVVLDKNVVTTGYKNGKWIITRY